MQKSLLTSILVSFLVVSVQAEQVTLEDVLDHSNVASPEITYITSVEKITIGFHEYKPLPICIATERGQLICKPDVESVTFGVDANYTPFLEDKSGGETDLFKLIDSLKAENERLSLSVAKLQREKEIIQINSTLQIAKLTEQIKAVQGVYAVYDQLLQNSILKNHTPVEVIENENSE